MNTLKYRFELLRLHCKEPVLDINKALRFSNVGFSLGAISSMIGLFLSFFGPAGEGPYAAIESLRFGAQVFFFCSISLMPFMLGALIYYFIRLIHTVPFRDTHGTHLLSKVYLPSLSAFTIGAALPTLFFGIRTQPPAVSTLIVACGFMGVGLLMTMLSARITDLKQYLNQSEYLKANQDLLDIHVTLIERQHLLMSSHCVKQQTPPTMPDPNGTSTPRSRNRL